MFVSFHSSEMTDARSSKRPRPCPNEGDDSLTLLDASINVSDMSQEPDLRVQLSLTSLESAKNRKRDRSDGDDGLSSSHKIHRGELDSFNPIESSDNITISLLSRKIIEMTVLELTQKKDIVAFLGGTGVGKTTTIDFLCGVEIVKVYGDDEYGDCKLDVDPAEIKQYLKIGHSSSMTKTIDFLSSPCKKTSSPLLFCGRICIMSILLIPHQIHIPFLQTCPALVMISLLTKY